MTPDQIERFVSAVERIATVMEKRLATASARPPASSSRQSTEAGGKPQEISKCRSCDADVYWVKTHAGKNMPVDASSYRPGDGIFDKQKGHVSHFETCPNASQHRSEKPKQSTKESTEDTRSSAKHPPEDALPF